ncbi:MULTISPECIES: hypothetical protein [Anaerotruncus]|uniref:Uncharacterized protein n=1 Tax=Anaerotruncus massiliensis (ex Togo et al. 2019) TaxID=1673720 RepID=A0ABR7AFF0_9FIRM|nr:MULTISPECIES: hypothetical protein [Anaerotruncus]MBC3939181.1 hypothetical protein [Anaerotruncus massiliensis (ex Togo et al. 2019)]
MSEIKFGQVEIAKTAAPLPVVAAEIGADKKTGEQVSTYTALLMRRGGITIKVKVPGAPVITTDEIASYLDTEGTPPLVQFAEDFEASFYAFAGKGGGVVSGISARASSAVLVTGNGGVK